MFCPSFDEQFHDLNQFILDLVAAFQSGAIQSWQDLEPRVQAFFTPERMAQMESRVPGWQKMSSYNQGVTLTHVMCVFMGLFMLPEFADLTTEQQNLMKWAILFHDVEKVVERGKRDPKHGFRSAVTAAQIMPTLGFETTALYNDSIDEWGQFTNAAVTTPEGAREPIQDNGKLPKILSGMDNLFGRNSSAALIVKTILLHMSIDVVMEWPQAAPLSCAEISTIVDQDLFSLLRCMMLADNEGWVMFYPEARNIQRQETLEVFEDIGAKIGHGFNPQV